MLRELLGFGIRFMFQYQHMWYYYTVIMQVKMSLIIPIEKTNGGYKHEF